MGNTDEERLRVGKSRHQRDRSRTPAPRSQNKISGAFGVLFCLVFIFSYCCCRCSRLAACSHMVHVTKTHDCFLGKKFRIRVTRYRHQKKDTKNPIPPVPAQSDPTRNPPSSHLASNRSWKQVPSPSASASSSWRSHGE